MKLPSLLYTSQVYFFGHGSKSFHCLELEGVTSVVDCVKCVPIPVIKQDNPPPWVFKNWTTHPLLFEGWKTDDSPLSATAHPSQLLFDQSLMTQSQNVTHLSLLPGSRAFDTLLSQSLPPPRCIDGYRQISCRGWPCDGLASHPRRSRNTLSRFMGVLMLQKRRPRGPLGSNADISVTFIRLRSPRSSNYNLENELLNFWRKIRTKNKWPTNTPDGAGWAGGG